MKRYNFAVILFFIAFINCGCFHHWSAKQKNDFKQKCSETETINNLLCQLWGFTFDEADTILVKEFKNGLKIDSFYIYPNKSDYDSTRNRIYVSNNLKNGYRKICVNNTYQFCVKNYTPIVLSNMKLEMRPHISMFSEDYACELYQYDVNGITNQGVNPDLSLP